MNMPRWLRPARVILRIARGGILLLWAAGGLHGFNSFCCSHCHCRRHGPNQPKSRHLECRLGWWPRLLLVEQWQSSSSLEQQENDNDDNNNNDEEEENLPSTENGNSALPKTTTRSAWSPPSPPLRSFRSRSRKSAVAPQPQYPQDSVVARLAAASSRAAAASAAKNRALASTIPVATTGSLIYSTSSTTTTTSSSSATSSSSPPPPSTSTTLPTLRQVLAALDAKLSDASGDSSATTWRSAAWAPPREGLLALMCHNDRYAPAWPASSSSPPPSSSRPVPVRHVALVLGKSPVMTVDYDARIQRLIQALTTEQYQPQVLVFLGGAGALGTTLGLESGLTTNNSNTAGKSPPPSATVAEVGYRHFSEVWDRQAHRDAIAWPSLIHLQDGASLKESLEEALVYLRETCLVPWARQCWLSAQREWDQDDNRQPRGNEDRFQDPYRQRPPKPKLQVHFSIFSSDYHLCQLHDIHERSPGQSWLSALETGLLLKRPNPRADPPSIVAGDTWTSSNSNNALDANDHVLDHIQLESTWSYQYATTVHLFTPPTTSHPGTSFDQAHDDDAKKERSSKVTKNRMYRPTMDGSIAWSLAAKAYRVMQELVPVWVNLRGIVRQQEFLQRDNYRALVASRRSLVSDMEALYAQQPSLRSLRYVIISGTQPMDQVLEGALLSLGRCLDLVRPAGLLIKSVPLSDWKIALSTLEQAMDQIASGCNVDYPLSLLVPKDDEVNKFERSGQLGKQYDQEEDESEEDESEEEDANEGGDGDGSNNEGVFISTYEDEDDDEWDE